MFKWKVEPRSPHAIPSDSLLIGSSNLRIIAPALTLFPKGLYNRRTQRMYGLLKVKRTVLTKEGFGEASLHELS